MSLSAKWGDLIPRILSAVVMVAVGVFAIAQGGLAFHGLIVAVTGFMVWELARMLGTKESNGPVWLGLLSAAVMAAAPFVPFEMRLPILIAPVLVGLSFIKGPKWIWACYMPVVVFGAFSALVLRDGNGVFWVLWLVGIVVASDVLGYFAGRILGGPKFWPSVSPKKTWSGTIAGWIGAAGVGVGFMSYAENGLVLVLISVGMAFASQMGDIAESAIKRRTGIKDSSHLIPGHGGFLDRFDGMLGALVVVLIVGQILPFLPEVG